MILGLILATAGICGLGYVMYSSGKQTNYPPVEDDMGKLLNQLVEHLHAYEQFYERRTWECYNAMQLCEQGMALPENEERALLREQLGQCVLEFNTYVNAMHPFCKQELDVAGNIALELKDKELCNPDHAALFHQCWQEMIPYVVDEEYYHTLLPSNEKQRDAIVDEARAKIVKRKQEYAQTNKEVLQWEQDYAYIKSEDIMAQAELETAKLDMQAADHALAVLLAENTQGEAITNALAQAAEQAALFKEAAAKAAEVDMARMELETVALDMQEAHHARAIVEQGRLEQILMDHQYPGQELHPNLPRGVRVVPGNDHQPPPPGGGWGSEFVEWIGSGIS